MYKKYIHYIRRVPFSLLFLFLLTWGGIIFSKTEQAEVGEALQYYKISTDFIVFAVVATTTPSD